MEEEGRRRQRLRAFVIGSALGASAAAAALRRARRRQRRADPCGARRLRERALLPRGAGQGTQRGAVATQRAVGALDGEQVDVRVANPERPAEQLRATGEQEVAVRRGDGLAGADDEEGAEVRDLEVASRVSASGLRSRAPARGCCARWRRIPRHRARAAGPARAVSAARDLRRRGGEPCAGNLPGAPRRRGRGARSRRGCRRARSSVRATSPPPRVPPGARPAPTRRAAASAARPRRPPRRREPQPARQRAVGPAGSPAGARRRRAPRRKGARRAGGVTRERSSRRASPLRARVPGRRARRAASRRASRPTVGEPENRQPEDDDEHRPPAGGEVACRAPQVARHFDRPAELRAASAHPDVESARQDEVREPERDPDNEDGCAGGRCGAEPVAARDQDVRALGGEHERAVGVRRDSQEDRGGPARPAPTAAVERTEQGEVREQAEEEEEAVHASVDAVEEEDPAGGGECSGEERCPASRESQAEQRDERQAGERRTRRRRGEAPPGRGRHVRPPRRAGSGAARRRARA